MINTNFVLSIMSLLILVIGTLFIDNSSWVIFGWGMQFVTFVNAMSLVFDLYKKKK
ncbi:hypothetical protein GCM10011573_34460 [Enterococcus wangshanyuanii]|uniref:Uncharacterized protein n=1 Tax=Enterococcus wangshanyuanii TaxID=2005703 RepID=A0ABQ1PRD3_9ENTE|nr:hypothetical protein GCM10011573_34460 [Enterococcus wangshanyuanii]